MTSDRPRRSGRRRAGPAEDVVERIVQPTLELPRYSIVTAEQVALVHAVSMRILEEAGMAFYDDESVSILRAHGVVVDDDQVARFDRSLVEEFVSKAPSSFSHAARNPDRDVVIGGKHMAFLPVAGPPFVYDVENGRRAGKLEDLVNFIKLTMSTPYLHMQGTEIVVPNDVPFHERALDINYAHIKYGDKPMMGHYPIGLAAQDSVEMARIVFGDETLDSAHVLIGVVNVSSPRRLDDRMLGLLKTYIRANQPVIVTPFILAGAMGPAAVLGTVAQANAEALATIAFAQMVRPGVPCVYGPFLAVVDLQNGSPVFGGAESSLAQFIVADMAHHYGLPFRAAGTYASAKVPDMQAGAEAALSMVPSILAGPNLVLHAAGWLESGLTTGYEKFVFDCEMLGVFQRLAAGVSWDEDEWAMDSLLTVEPGGHHLGTEHTLERFRTAFHRMPLFDADSFESWSAAGAHDAAARSSNAVAVALERYVQPPLDEAIDAELQDYMTRRRPQIDPSDFQ
ncbi:MAG: trimethylamine methyltransferase family protein [Acidimicrobiia bacterium]|nr:trimethylamine methyltransferase family protein [Acidimicrobiia bacterium]